MLNRFVPLRLREPLLWIGHHRFFALQKELRDGNAATLAGFDRVTRLDERLKDFGEPQPCWRRWTW